MQIRNAKIALSSRVVRMSVSNLKSRNMHSSWVHVKMPEQVKMRAHRGLRSTIHMGMDRGIRTKGRLKDKQAFIVGRARDIKEQRM